MKNLDLRADGVERRASGQGDSRRGVFTAATIAMRIIDAMASCKKKPSAAALEF
jgi:hypothetical protein